MSEHTAVKMRAYPTEDQRKAVSTWLGCSRFVYNWALSLKRQEYKTWVTQGKPAQFNWSSYLDMQAMLPDLKTEHPWLALTPARCLQSSLRNLDTAFRNWFKGTSEYPRFKARSHGMSCHISHQQITEKHLSKSGKWLRIRLPNKVGVLKCRCTQSKPVGGRLLRTVLSRNACGAWYVVLVYEVSDGYYDKPSTAISERCGVDLGVVKPLTVAYLKNGLMAYKILGVPERAKLVLLEKKRKRYQRIWARKHRCLQKQQRKIKPDGNGEIVRLHSNRLENARIAVAKIHQKATNIRNNFAQVTSNALSAKFKLVKYEDIVLSNMTKQVKQLAEGTERKGVASKTGLNRELLRLGLGRIVKLTEIKSAHYGHAVGFVSARFTSQRCSCCGTIDKKSRKTQSLFECTSCGFTANADTNAATNILERKLKTA